MKKNVLALIFILFLIFNRICFSAESKDIKIVYPCNNAKIKAASTFLVGCTDSRCKLYINNEEITVYPSGSFVKVVPLKYGVNDFSITTKIGKDQKTIKYRLFRSGSSKAIPKYPMQILKNSISPKSALFYDEGDIIPVEFQGSTCHYAYFKIGNKTIPMRELSKMETGVIGIYKGFYKILPNDNFRDAKITVFLDDGKTKISKIAPGSLSVVPKDNFALVRCLNEKTVIRETPNGDRLPPLPKDTVLTINASDGDFYRAALTPDKNIWINKKDVAIISKMNYVQPQTDLSDLSIYADKDNFYLSLPMEYKLPVIVEHPAPNKLRLDIYGSHNNFLMEEYKDEEIKSLKIIEPQSQKLSLLLEMNDKQIWGYDYYHQNDEFILKIVKEPSIKRIAPLQDIVIALDAGHGGTEKGSVGPTGICEKDVNLQIIKYLKEELETAGAKVILTRNCDLTTEIYSRPEIAKQNKALILLSIHNNALPDGQDPYAKNGSGTYYYQEQAKPLAEAIQASMLANLKLRDDGVNKASFVLTRSTIPISVLVECAYMINPNEYEMLIDSNYQKEFAKAIKHGVEDFLIKQAN
ncbi:MAG: N-acetylmuramoyl-L-alanine amidase [bacterium]